MFCMWICRGYACVARHGPVVNRGENGRGMPLPYKNANNSIIFDIRLCLNATIIDGDARCRAFRGLANGDN